MGTSQTRYTAEFKVEAVKQVVERGHRVSDVANRLGVSKWSLHQWLRAYREQQPETARPAEDTTAELRRLRAELKRVTEERDILRKATAYFAKQSG